MRTRPIAIAMVVATSALLGAGGQLSYYEESMPTTMNPLFARSMVDRRSHELVFDRLYYRSSVTGDVVSRLIANSESLEGGTKVKLTPKEGIKWHDGEPFGAADICFTIDAMLNPATPSHQSKGYREVLTGCVVDKKAAIVSFAKAYYNPSDRLSFSVLPKHVFAGNTAIQPDHEFSVRPTGTGPMKGSRGKKEVRFEAKPNAHHAPRLEVLAMGEGGDPLVQVRTIMNKGVSGLISVAPPLRAEIASTDDVTLKSYDLRSWWFIAVNTAGKLADKRVRQALNLTIDREELRRLTMGYDPDDIEQPSQFISGPFVPSSPYYNRSIRPVTRSDLAKAKGLLTAAGAVDMGGTWTLKGEPMTLKIGMNSPLDLEAKDLLNQIGNQLQTGGFGRQVEKVSADDWSRKAITGELRSYDLLVGKWSFGVVEDVAPMFQTRAGGAGSFNIFNYSNPEVDQLLKDHDMATTDTAAQDAYYSLHEKLADELPYLFLWKLDTKSAWRIEVQNNTIAPFFYFTEFDSWSL
jgi:peptide/nickel transport system substrate-binding protein